MTSSIPKWLDVVYFIQCGPAGPIKIGITKRGLERRRLRALQTGCPYELHLLGSVFGDEADERALHRKFREHHIRGEWFRPAPALLDAIPETAADDELEAALDELFGVSDEIVVW